MKKIFINKKLIFTTVIALTTLLYTQESLTRIMDRSNGKVIDGLVGQALFYGTSENGIVDYMIDGPIDVIKNFSNGPVVVTVHNSGTFCSKITMNIPAHTMTEIPSSRCSRNNRINIDVQGSFGKNNRSINQPREEWMPRIFEITTVGEQSTNQNIKQRLNSDARYIIIQK